MRITLSLTALLLFCLCLVGCGGGPYGSVAGSLTNQSSPCKGINNEVGFFVNYPARSRASTDLPWTSALSGKLVLAHTAANGQDLTTNFNRNPSDATAHKEMYYLSGDAKTISTTGTFSFYAAADQSGAVVGTATVPVTIDCKSMTVGTISITSTAIVNVSGIPTTMTVGDQAKQLTFTATDKDGVAVVVTPGSAFFQVTSGTAAMLTKDGMATPVAAGTINFTVTIDGVTSAPAMVTINPVKSGPTYHLIDLGRAATYTDGPGRQINNNGDCLVHTGTISTPVDYLINLSTPTVKTLLGSTDSNNIDHDLTTFALNSAGTVVGGGVGIPAQIWNAADYAHPVTTKTTADSASWRAWAINASGQMIGGLQANPQYWAGPTAVEVPLAIGAFTWVDAWDINDSGLIVGRGQNGTRYDGVYFTKFDAQPTLLASLSGNGTEAKACNANSAIVGLSTAASGQVQAVMWDSPTGSPHVIGIPLPSSSDWEFGLCINNTGVAVGRYSSSTLGAGGFIYSSTWGPLDMFSVCDATRTGWTITGCYGINDNGNILGLGTFGGIQHAFIAVPN